MRVRWAWISACRVCAECAALGLFEEIEKRIRDCMVERGQAQNVTAFDVTRRSESAVSGAGLFFCHSSMRMSVREEYLSSKRLWVLTV